MATNLQLFKQVDQLSNELRDARLEAERANQRARQSKEHRDNLRTQLREAKMRADSLGASLSALERQRLLETFDTLLTASDSIQEESNSKKAVEASSTHAMNTRASNEEPAYDEQVSISHASATNADGTADLSHGSNQAVMEDVQLTDSYSSPTLGEAQWKPNTSKCFLCDRSFTLFCRRHHCRNCGNCVCADCSPFRVRLEAVAQRPSSSSFVGSAVRLPNSKSDFEPMSRPMAHRICTECHGVGIGTFVAQSCY